MIKGIHHVSILTSDVARSIKFYSGILGLTPSDKRPDLGFEGTWFELGQQQVHLIQADPVPATGKSNVRGGRDRHIAFQVDDINHLIEILESEGIEFERSRTGRAALFCRDPDGNALEFIDSN